MSPQRIRAILHVYHNEASAAAVERGLDAHLTAWSGSDVLRGEVPPLDEFDVVLVDWHVTFASAIPQVQECNLSGVPVVVITSGKPLERLMALSLDADYVEPFPPSAMAIETLIQAHGRRRDRIRQNGTVSPKQKDGFADMHRESTLGDGAPPDAEKALSITAELNHIGDGSLEPSPLSPCPAIQIDLARNRCFVNGTHLRLSPTTFRVLRYLIEHSDTCCERQAILDSVWGSDYIPTSNVVDYAVHQLRKRLAPHDLDRYIETISGVGYQYQHPTP